MTNHIHPADLSRKDGGNVVLFPRTNIRLDGEAQEFRRLRVKLIMAQAEAGTLNPRVVEYLLAGAGLHA